MNIADKNLFAHFESLIPRLRPLNAKQIKETSKTPICIQNSPWYRATPGSTHVPIFIVNDARNKPAAAIPETMRTTAHNLCHHGLVLTCCSHIKPNFRRYPYRVSSWAIARTNPINTSTTDRITQLIAAVLNI